MTRPIENIRGLHKTDQREPDAEEPALRLRVYRLGRMYPGHIVPDPIPHHVPLMTPATEAERLGDEAEAIRLARSKRPPIAAGGVVSRQGAETAEKLAEVIPLVIAPTSWESQGSEGVIRAVGGNLIVRQTEPVHREIRRLLKALN